MRSIYALLISAASASPVMADVSFYDFYNTGGNVERVEHSTAGHNGTLGLFGDDIAGFGVNSFSESFGTGPGANALNVSVMGDSQGVLFDGDLRTEGTFWTDGFREEYTEGSANAFFSVHFQVAQSTDFLLDSSMSVTANGFARFAVKDGLNNPILTGDSSQGDFSSVLTLGPGNYVFSVSMSSQTPHDRSGDTLFDTVDATVGLTVIPAPGTFGVMSLGLIACTRRRR